VLFSQIFEIIRVQLKRGIDEDVDLAEALDSLFDRFLAKVALANIARDHGTTPSFSTATARPIPESPPVINATLPSSFFEPTYYGASYIGAGSSLASMPGFLGCCLGNGGTG